MHTTALADLLHLSTSNALLLERRTKHFVFQRSGPVIHKGQAVSGAYIVLAGELRVYTCSPDGAEATLYLLHRGETCVLTLNCLFNDLRYPAWVEATANSEVAMIPGDLYRQLFAEEAAVRETTVTAMSGLVFRLMDELEEIHTLTLEQRLARFLLNNASHDGVVRMTQQQLASHLGTTREVIARLLQGMRNRRMLSTGRGKVIVGDAALLASLVTPEDAEWPA